MKALSIRQPYLDAILAGIRTVEVRGHATRHRGELLLHASAVYGPAEREALARLRVAGHTLDDPPPERRGAILGLVDLVDCRPMTEADWAAALMEPRGGEWWAWLLDRPHSLPPTRVRGHIWMFDVEPEAITQP